jgi:hypothetical protein
MASRRAGAQATDHHLTAQIDDREFDRLPR